MSLIQAYSNGFIHKDSITKTYSFVVKGKVVGRSYESISDLIEAQKKPVSKRKKTSTKSRKRSVVDNTERSEKPTSPEQTQDSPTQPTE